MSNDRKIQKTWQIGSNEIPSVYLWLLAVAAALLGAHRRCTPRTTEKSRVEPLQFASAMEPDSILIKILI